MKKAIRSILSIAIVLCVLISSMVTGTFALSGSANNLRKQIVAAINSLEVTADTTEEDIIGAVTSIDALAETTWKVDFTKILPTDGAKITLNGVEVEGGTVRGFAGSIKGILNVTSAGNNFDVAVDFTLEPTYEIIDCKEQATVYMTANGTYATDSNNNTTADLVVIEQPSSGTQWSVPKNYFYTSDTDYNSTIKAVVVKYNVVNVLDDAFRKMTALKAVVFPGIVKMYSNSFYASKVEYIDFGTRENDATSRRLEFATNAFAWSEVKNLYMGGYNSLKIDKGAFTGCDQMNQILVDIDTISSVTTGALNTQGDNKPSITTVVCQNETAANIFTTAGAAAAIDVSKTAIVDYYSKVSKIKVIDEVSAEYVISAAEALDTDNAFTVSAEKKDNVFEVSITDVNSVTAVAYVETFAAADIEANIKTILDEYSYTDATTQENITDCIQNVLGNGYTITWLEDYSVYEKVDGAEVWARETEEDEYTLYGTVPGQDKATHGIFVINKEGKDSVVIELNKVLEKAEYEKYELNGVQKTYGASKNGDSYDGSSELIIVNSTIYSQHLAASVIDSGLETSISQNIKAIVVKGNFDAGAWTCFDGLTGLEVIIFDNQDITELGYAMVRNCTSLKYAYISDNVTTLKKGTSTNKQSAFYGCTSLGKVLVGANLDTNTFCVGGDNTTAVLGDAVIRYTTDSATRKLLDFFKEVSAIPSAANVDEINTKLMLLPSYHESFTTEISENGDGFTVEINDLLYANMSITTPEGIKENVAEALSNFVATNETTSADIENVIIGVPGVQTVQWSDQLGFRKILATDGAQITYNGKIVDDGLVRGYAGSITGIVTLTTAFGDTFDVKVAVTIDPTYEIINCTNKVNVTIDSDDDTYLTSGGNIFADLVIINVTNPNGNIPVNYFGASETIKNGTIKAVIVQGEVRTVLEKAFQYTNALQALVFNNVSGINNQAFWASSVKYVDFGTGASDFSIGNANAFGWCKNLEALYIANKNNVKIGNNAFDGCKNLTQIRVDAKTVESVSANAVNTNANADGSITTVVCNGKDAVSKFEAAGALAVIDAKDREISAFDINYDFKANVLDLIRLKRMLVASNNNTDYDVNTDGEINSLDLTTMKRGLLGVLNNNAIYVGENTKVSAETTVENFGNYSSVSDDEATALRNSILIAEDTIKVSGNTWYISNDGDDSNEGNSPQAAWKTLSALTKYADKIEAGDAVLFRRGDVFRGSRVTTESNVSYGAYGEGDKPAIYGSKLNYAEETWVRTENKNIYSLRADISTDIGMIIFNHGEAYGYKMLNSVSECDSDYEFYHDRAEGILYLYCSSGRPSDVFYDIELLYNQSIIYVPNGAENVYIENISVKYTGAHGISVGMPVSGITIKNCEIGWIGGSIHKDDNTRYGNGIQFYGQTTDAVVENCWVYQCYDAGLTHQFTGGDNGNAEANATNISYTNNLVEFCSYSLEYFWNWQIDGEYVENANVYMKDILVENNIMRFAGYGLGQTRPDPINMGHIVTWMSYNTIDNFVIQNNTFDMSTLRLFAVSTYEDINPTFVGNRYIQSSDYALGRAYTNNRANGGDIAMNADALSNFDSTGTLTIIG